MKFLDKYTDHTYALLRIVGGLLFMGHGIQKFFNFPIEFPYPLNPMSIAAGGIEVVGGAAIALGPKGKGSTPKPRGPNLAPAAANAVAASRNTSFRGPGRYRLPGQTAAGSNLNLEMARRSASSTFTPARASRFAGFKANLQTGTAGVPLSPGAQRDCLKQDQKQVNF